MGLIFNKLLFLIGFLRSNNAIKFNDLFNQF
jgi:hypothetical protein